MFELIKEEQLAIYVICKSVLQYPNAHFHLEAAGGRLV
jgi:hypothetical protein